MASSKLTVRLACLLLVAALAQACGGYGVEVTKWSVGSAEVTGTITNNDVACSDPEITLHLRDHNGAIVRDFTFGAGELASGASRKWSTHLVGLLMIDAPVTGNVTAIDADATCADRH